MAVNKELVSDEYSKTAKTFGIVSFFFGVILLSIFTIRLANHYKKEHNGYHCKDSQCAFICGVTSLIIWIALISAGLYFGLR